MTIATIVTPTRPGREEVLLDRCVASVIEQRDVDSSVATGLAIDHVIISDPNPELREEFGTNAYPHVTYVELNDTWRDGRRDRSHGAFPWYVGSLLAQGAYVGFLGDDDELLSHHVQTHVDAMERSGADFTVSCVRFVVGGEERFIVGDRDLAWTHVDADGIMCRRSALAVASWDPFDLTPPYADAADYRLVRDWMKGGLSGVFIDEVTATHHDGWAAGQGALAR